MFLFLLLRLARVTNAESYISLILMYGLVSRLVADIPCCSSPIYNEYMSTYTSNHNQGSDSCATDMVN